jgi:DNA repair protein RAD50
VADHSNLQGQIVSLRESLKSFKIELMDNKYKDIEKRLLDLNVKYHLTKDICTEVTEKHDALEESLMYYHHEKMKEINRTLADFWKITYKGNDIETIMIKTDAEKT